MGLLAGLENAQFNEPAFKRRVSVVLQNKLLYRATVLQESVAKIRRWHTAATIPPKIFHEATDSKIERFARSSQTVNARVACRLLGCA